MPNIKRRYFALAAGVAVAGGLALAAPAQAVTPGCAANGFCGTQKNLMDGLVTDNFQQRHASNNKQISFGNSVTDPGVDYIAFHPTSGPGAGTPSAKDFEWSPQGVKSGFCMSDPGPGFGAADLIVLRPCNDSAFQTWVPTEDPDNSGWFAWRNVSSHQFLQSDGLRTQLTDVKDGTVGHADNNQPIPGRTDQDWQFTQAAS